MSALALILEGFFTDRLIRLLAQGVRVRRMPAYHPAPRPRPASSSRFSRPTSKRPRHDVLFMESRPG